MIVDLAVKDDDISAILGFHRLMAGGGEIDDRKTTVPQADMTV